ncbi:MAG: alpha/beta hydrolase [Pseudomonadales bacterium]
MRLIKRLLQGLALLALVLIGAGALYQWQQSRADAARFPPPGALFEVGGLTLHLDCRGRGRPLVLLEAGLTSGSWSWGTVFDAIAAHTEVCAYDRPGMGWSDPIDRVADAGEVAQRLHALVETAAVSGPYVLLGMSAGGVYVREYYRRYPESVVGMVLVDSSHEQQGLRLPAVDGGATLDRVLTLCSWLQPLGVVRFSDALALLFDQTEIPDAARPLLRSRVNQSHYCASMRREIESFAADVRDAEPPASLGDLPLVVLSQGDEPEGDEAFGMSDAQARAMRVVWDELQLELTALSSRGERHVARDSGHVIQLEQPDIVIEAVVGLIGRLRAEARP